MILIVLTAIAAIFALTGCDTASEQITYTITYDANGATGGDPPASQTKSPLLPITLATNSGELVKTGHTFSGWNTQSDGEGDNYGEAAEYSADADVTLYAKWVQNTIATPTFSLVAGTYTSDQSVEISCATEGSTIYYTTDGSTPTASSSVYSSAISVVGDGTTMTIKSLAVAEGYKNSSVVSTAYIIDYATTATPTFSPAADTYTSDQSVTISCETAGATIYYTTDGSDPTTSSSAYSTAIDVAGDGTSMTIKAIAIADGYKDSPVTSVTYTITYAKASTPTFSPVAGTYTSDLSVEISCATAGATIYYTTDGTTPTTSSTAYTSAITVNASMTLKAVAVKTGYKNSDIGSVEYVLPIAFTKQDAIGIGSEYYVLAEGDLDGDGDIDIIPGEQTILGHYYSNGGDGVFTQTNLGVYASLTTWYPVDTADFDGDGLGEIITKDLITDQTDAGFSGFVSIPDMPTGHHLADMEIKDLDGDGDPDIIGNEKNSADNNYDLVWYENTSSTDSLDFSRHILWADSYSFYHGFDMTDIDNDGDMDILVSRLLTIGETIEKVDLCLLRNNGDRTFGPYEVIQKIGILGAHFRLLDINMDGYLDIAFLENHYIYFYTNNGSYDTVSFSDYDLISTPEYSSFLKIKVGDLDQDGKTDIVYSAGTYIYRIMNSSNNGNPNLLPKKIHSNTDSWYYKDFVVTDIDTDGDLDVAFPEHNYGGIVWYKNSLK